MTSKTVACLAGDGVGPELMAAATRALDGVARLHGWSLDDVHLPFAGEGVTRSGHPLPAETRARYRDADAILVASSASPALEGVKADLQLAWRVAGIHLGPGRDLVVMAPVGGLGQRHRRRAGVRLCERAAWPDPHRRRVARLAGGGRARTSSARRSRGRGGGPRRDADPVA